MSYGMLGLSGTIVSRFGSSLFASSIVALNGASSILFCGKYDINSLTFTIQSVSFSVAKCATPLVALCTEQPPKSSFVTSSFVTVLITSGPVKNM